MVVWLVAMKVANWVDSKAAKMVVWLVAMLVAYLVDLKAAKKGAWLVAQSAAQLVIKWVQKMVEVKVVL